MRRAHEIRRILDARFGLSGLEEWKRKDPAWWISPGNDIGRDAELDAALAGIASPALDPHFHSAHAAAHAAVRGALVLVGALGHHRGGGQHQARD